MTSLSVQDVFHNGARTVFKMSIKILWSRAGDGTTSGVFFSPFSEKGEFACAKFVPQTGCSLITSEVRSLKPRRKNNANASR